ncbi:Hypothetical predicted protein [Mytilus galloprovincialis]|uniref:Mitochondria-eating protein C-terminal domain-containing protein n=1 Tax=Mytilus galloprovincialis TaxID=29158 RepID=A0A8B6D4N3_MYTGA|nr:Hypothetical predicted protein [Mytilus galloprovincialis]
MVWIVEQFYVMNEYFRFLLRSYQKEKVDEKLQMVTIGNDSDNDSKLIETDIRLKDYEEKINVLQREKSDALTRLSEVMGSKLRDNNPAITDLNDPNRPMKLGDQFSELYENEWTDGYSELKDSKKSTEIEIIEILIKILKEIYETCLTGVSQQLSGHRSAVHVSK